VIVTYDQAKVLLEAHKKLVERLMTLTDALADVSSASTELTAAVLDACHKQEDHEVI